MSQFIEPGWSYYHFGWIFRQFWGDLHLIRKSLLLSLLREYVIIIETYKYDESK